jgi:ABC-type Fe3+-hydroxamate transport system substrate-binding protein
MASDSELLKEIHERTIRMDAALFGASNGDEGFVKRTNARLNDHSKRVGQLEKWRYYIAGGIAVIVFLIGQHLIRGEQLVAKPGAEHVEIQQQDR